MKAPILNSILAGTIALGAAVIMARSSQDKAFSPAITGATQITAKDLPDLIKALSRRNSVLEQGYCWVYDRLPGGISGRLPEIYPADLARLNAAAEVGQLGPVASPAVPQLIRLLRDDIADANAAQSLGLIGAGAKAAIPALISAARAGCPFAAIAAQKIAMATNHARPLIRPLRTYST